MPDRPLSILIVEDDDVDVMSFRRALKQVGFAGSIRVEPDGEAAWQWLDSVARSATEEEPRPDLMLVDVNMPRMNGLELLERTKSDHELCLIPTVVLTTSVQPSDRDRAYRLGAAGYVRKPANYTDFAEAVREITSYWSTCELPDR